MGCWLSTESEGVTVEVTNKSSLPVVLWVSGAGPVWQRSGGSPIVPAKTTVKMAPGSAVGLWQATIAPPCPALSSLIIWEERVGHTEGATVISLTVNFNSALPLNDSDLALSLFTFIVAKQRAVRMALHDKLRRQKAIQDSTERRAARVLTKRARELLAQLTRLCPVCLEDCPITSLTKLADCGHKVCTPCANAFVDAELLGGKAYVRCPWAGCDRLLGKAVLRQFGSAAAWDAYESSRVAMHTQRCATRGTRHYDPAPRTTRRRERTRLRRLVDETDRGFLLFCADQARRCPSCMVVIWRWAGCLARETAPHTLAARRSP